jgi:O-antigen ligase
MFEAWDPLNPHNLFSIPWIIGIAYILSLLPHLRMFFRIAGIRHWLVAPAAFMLLLTVQNAMNTNRISDTIVDTSIGQCILLFWVLLVHERQDPTVLERSLVYYMYGAIAVSLMYILNFGVSQLAGRITILGENQNRTGITMTIGLAILLVTVVQNPLGISRARLGLLPAIAPMLLLLIETGSRVAGLSFLAGLLIAFLAWPSRNALKKGKMILLGGGVLIAVVSVILQFEIAQERLFESVMAGDLAGRDKIWDSIIQIIVSHPLVGIGETGYAAFSVPIFGIVRSPHNVILEILCYTGVVGLVLFVVFLGQLTFAAFRARRINGSLLPMILLSPITGLVLSGQILNRKIVWALFAFIATKANSIKR